MSPGVTGSARSTLHTFVQVQETMLSLTRCQATLLVQLRTGHVHCRNISTKLARSTLPGAPHARTGMRLCTTFDHMPSVHHARNRMIAALRRATRSVSMLLANPKAFPHLFKYMHDMRHFHSILGDLQSTLVAAVPNTRVVPA